MPRADTSLHQLSHPPLGQAQHDDAVPPTLRTTYRSMSRACGARLVAEFQALPLPWSRSSAVKLEITFGIAHTSMQYLDVQKINMSYTATGRVSTCDGDFAQLTGQG